MAATPPPPLSDSDEDYELIDQSIPQSSAKATDSSQNDVDDSRKNSESDAETLEDVDTSQELFTETISEAALKNNVEDSLDQSEENQERRGNEEVTPQVDEEADAAQRRNEDRRNLDWFILASLVLLIIIDHFADQKVIEREKNLTQTYERQIQKHQMDFEGMRERLLEMQKENVTATGEIAAQNSVIEYLKNQLSEAHEMMLKLEQIYKEKNRHSDNVIRELNRDIEIKTVISKNLEAQLKKMKSEKEDKNVELNNLKKENEERKKVDERLMNEPFRTVSMPLAKTLGFTVTGPFVSSVKEGGIAFLNSGLREGDQIFSIHGIPVRGISAREVSDLIDEVRHDPENRKLTMVVRNNLKGLVALERVFIEQDEFAKRKGNM